MPHGAPSAPDFPGLASLHRGFAIALSHEKFDSAGKASKGLKIAHNGKAKKEIIEACFSAWREGCGSAIRKFFPQYIELGMAYPDRLTSDVVGWAHEQAWIPLCGQCGVQKYGFRHPHHSHSVIWWLSVAIDGSFDVNMPGHPPWCAPKWLAANSRETDMLIADWSHWLSARFAGVLDEAMEAARVKVAIATAPSEYQKWTPEQVPAIASTFTWKELETRFRDVQAKLTPSQRVVAQSVRIEWDSTSSVCEEWHVSGYRPYQMEFENLASIAARKLGYLLGEDVFKDWLGRVREWMQEAGLDREKNVAWYPSGRVTEHGVSGTTRGMYTEWIAELSAMFCTKLMACGTPESAVPPPSEPSGIAERLLKPTSVERKTHKTKTQLGSELRRKRAIFGAIQAGLKGRKYCSELDSSRLHLPSHWTEEGCPATYAEAYRSPAWRKRIQDEKHRFGKLYSRTPQKEREGIIQGDTGTRRTRH